MRKNVYIPASIQVFEASYGENLMKWVSTPMSDDEITDDEFNAKSGFLDEEEEGSWVDSPTIWDR